MPTAAFQCFSGSYLLARHPPAAPDEPLQAWDAADDYLLSEAAPLLQGRSGLPAPRVLIVNDQFGALAVALHAYNLHSWGDSFTAELALAENLRRNDLLETITFIPATMVPPGSNGDPSLDVDSGYDLVLWRVPKALALFEQQVAAMQRLVRPDTVVLAGGMARHLSDRTKDVLGQLGTVSVAPVQKKAVLLRLTLRPDVAQMTALPERRETPLVVPEYGLELTAGPNVFANDKVDAGTRFLMEQFAQLPSAERIADLGCGNGILGLHAQRLQPTALLHFVDDSYQAVAAAESNYRRNIPSKGQDGDEPSAQFHVADGLSRYDSEPFDVVLCNPPFHLAHTISDQTAWEMFVQSKRHLRMGGELWIVGNRHLGYHVKLRRLFGNCRQIAVDPRFVVLAATKR